MRSEHVWVLYLIIVIIIAGIVYGLMKFQNNDDVDKDSKSIYKFLIGLGVVLILLLLFTILKITADSKPKK